MDKCIFRNKIDIIDNISYFYDNDIVFGLNKFYKPQANNIIPNTIGYYLIDQINDKYYDILKNFTIEISKNYKINFLLFHKSKDIFIINKLINDCDLENYNIIFKDNTLDLIDEISKNEKHLCLRFHSHVICYLYKLQFISFPLTSKTIQFNRNYNINHSFELDKMLDLVDNQNILFNELSFNFNILDSFFTTTLTTKNNYKLLSIWATYNEIYDNFIPILKNKTNITQNHINYLSDQIELNIIGYLNSCYKYGINEKINNLITNYEMDNHKLQTEFVKIMIDIYKK
jgi:hypothetical protein